MPIKLVVFDMAGTTVKDDNDVTAAFQSAIAAYGYQIPAEIINPLMGYEKKTAITKMLNIYEADHTRITTVLIDSIHHKFVELMISHYLQTPKLTALPHAEETMAALRSKGVKIGINTGFSRVIADTIIARLQWREKGLFDYLIGSDEVPAGRPDPAMIFNMMQLAGITDAQEVAKVGDTEVDIREGQNAGCRYVIGVTTGTFSRETLQPYAPTHIIDDIAEVINIIN
ncbi:HAD-IA family hydrolase [Mucilaginibacter polytrichastri]|uniref:Phosphonoacetaldehyde hydrolase n=1 Tax=Mucilaginibacter polytrichastri TaxID=1302689 RepID=A0A1Q6A0H5_9SPHI|nr:HAD-IA family hydrolase [Mucilaginibacter polytrichastri]OKS87503.1 hypothetical protein RG47T_2964 [Mucilaginibacter polytrichastri]SFS91461.1 phosphonatase-like hydrolase [Mucilaginibacter polytrichastri]